MMIEKLSFSNIPLKEVIAGISPNINELGAFDGIVLKFDEVSSNHIYRLSTDEVVREFPEWLKSEGFTIDTKQLVYLFSAMINTISAYAYSFREGKDLVFEIKENETKRRLKIFVTKHFVRQGYNLGRYKIEFTFYNYDEMFGEYEEIRFRFTKRDVLVLFSFIKQITSYASRTKTIMLEGERIDAVTGEKIDDTIVGVTKVDNSLTIGGVWLHGQEILNLAYVMDELTFDFYAKEHLDSYRSFYRQISIAPENGTLYLYLSKMNAEHQYEFMEAKGRKFIYKIPISAVLMSVANMFLSPHTLRHAEFNLPDTGENYQSSMAGLHGIRYHVSYRESAIGVGLKNGKIFLAGKLHDQFLEEAKESGFDILDFFKISIDRHLYKLLSALSTAYTKSYLDHERTFNMTRFFVDANESIFGMVRYEFEILSNVENKASAIFRVRKYKKNGKQLTPIGSFRQPLFKKGLFQLMWILMAAIEEKESFEYYEDVDAKERLSYKYYSLKKVEAIKAAKTVKFGVKVKEDTDWKLQIGSFFKKENKPHKTEFLEKSDTVMLEIASAYRIFRGDWLPFTGNKISVGPDRYFTDKYGEINLEKEFLSGEKWASVFFISSSISDSKGNFS